MGEKLEQVARALAKLNLGEAAWEQYAEDARAVVKALREPTEAMRQNLPFDESMWFVWTTVIDEILK